MKRLKVVFLFTPGPIGGAEKIILHGLEALRDEIQDLELWILKEEKVFEVTHQFLKLVERVGVNYRVYTLNSAVDLNILRELREDFREHCPDIVHTHGMKAAVYGKLTANSSAKFVISHHAASTSSFKDKFYESIEKIILKKADAVITPSDGLKEELVRAHIPTEKLFVVENLLTAKIRQYINRSLPRLRLVYAGKLSAKKKISDLIEAIQRTNAELLLIGEGEERPFLEKKVEELKLNHRVKFLGFKKDVSPYLTHTHALVLMPTEKETPPTFVEASCMGIPVIKIQEEDGCDSILEKIRDFEERQDTLIEEAQRKKSDFIDRFSPKKWAQNILDIYVTTLSVEK